MKKNIDVLYWNSKLHRFKELSPSLKPEIVYLINSIAANVGLYDEREFIDKLNKFRFDFQKECRLNMSDNEEEL
mgnify:CR=1 FL=1